MSGKRKGGAIPIDLMELKEGLVYCTCFIDRQEVCSVGCFEIDYRCQSIKVHFLDFEDEEGRVRDENTSSIYLPTSSILVRVFFPDIPFLYI